MILLTLLCLFIDSRAFAIPTGHPPLPPTLSNVQSILIRDNTPSNTRTIWNIIWSCFSTVFACAWIAVHPNIPAPGDSQWKILRRHMMIMAYVLLAPELVIIWAARQHRDAKVLAEKFQIEGRPGWTKTHAFFLIMGGFTLHKQGKPLRVLKWRDLRVLAGAGRIDWPDITEEEIKDRSKGDYLSKGIVVLQTTWFIAQFFARAASKLTVTELEVVTLAFSLLVGIIYYLWWDKPLDVRCSIPVHLVEHSTRSTNSDNTKNNNSLPGNYSLCHPLPIEVPPTLLEGEVAPQGDRVRTDHPPSSPSRPPSQHNSNFHSIPTTLKDPPGLLSQSDSLRESTSSIRWMRRLHLLIQESCSKRGTLGGLIHAFVTIPIHFLFIAQFNAMVSGCTLETNTAMVTGCILQTGTRKPNDQPIDTLLGNGPLRVPTFYSYAKICWKRFFLGVCVSILFGGVHCIAWYDEFPSSPERWGWRISVIIVSTVPLGILLLYMMNRMGIVKEDSIIFQVFGDGFAWLYTTSRIMLLVLPLIALRALPPGAYIDLDWASIIPHI